MSAELPLAVGGEVSEELLVCFQRTVDGEVERELIAVA
jgi:hypothetical protein